jgi:uncharacterized protein (DUF58 family)
VILFTPRALGVAAALALFGIAGLWVPWGLDAMLVADLALVLLSWADAMLAPSVGEPPRREAPPAFSLGHDVPAFYHWTNRSNRRALMRVREVRPTVLGGSQPDRIVRVPARGSLREEIRVVPASRGRTDESDAALYIDSRGPLGLGLRRRRIDVPWHGMVYPPLVSMRLKASVAEARRRREAGIHAARRLGEGRMFESLREWVPGDDVRNIDWKATARRRKFITRQFEAERRQHVLLAIDAGRLMTAEVRAGKAGETAAPGAEGVSRMEFVVQAALELAYAAAQHDDNVGIMVFADGVQHFAAPQRGRLGLKRVLDILAVTEPKLVESDYPGAFRYLAARNRKRALTVLFTDVIDRLASEALVANVASLVPRHLPLAVTLRNPELDRVATSRPVTPYDGFRKAAAEELLRARDDAIAHMRRAGVLVLDVPPQKAAQAVVGQYHDLKRRGVL